MSTFAERASELTQGVMVGVAMSLAKEVGIFQALVDADSPLTSHQVALAGGLKERYVRELLGCISTAELVQVSKREDGELHYSLEDEAKKALEGQVGALMSIPCLAASAFQTVKDCVLKDGPIGVRFNDGHHDVLDRISRDRAPNVVQVLLQNVPGLKTRLEEGIHVMEFGAGRGRLSATFANQFPNSRFVASEVVPDLVKTSSVHWAHIPNLSFSLDDICCIPEEPDKQFDWIFCYDVIHDLPDPLAALKGIKRMLGKPAGIFTFIDVTTSGSPILDKGNMTVAMYYACGSFFCIPESYQREDSLALGPCFGKQKAVKLAQEAGFQVTDTDIEGKKAIFICQLQEQS